MKTLEKNQFDINKTTMRELTPYELSEVAGGGQEDRSIVIFTAGVIIGITISIATRTN
jgi:hypothetical protein